jgi:hypothetical protein
MNFINFFPMKRGKSASAAASVGSNSGNSGKRKPSESTILSMLEKQAANEAQGSNTAEGVKTRGARASNSAQGANGDGESSGPPPKGEEEFEEENDDANDAEKKGKRNQGANPPRKSQRTFADEEDDEFEGVDDDHFDEEDEDVGSESDSGVRDEVTRYEYGSDDSQGEEYFGDEHRQRLSSKSAKLARLRSKKRAARITGPSKKMPDNVIVDAYGKRIPTKSGFVTINLGKFLLRALTQEELDSALSKKRDKKGNTLTTSHYICRLHAHVAETSHPQFVLIGKDTGNIMKHCDRFHQRILEALERLIAEKDAKDATATIHEYLDGLKAPGRTLDALVSRRTDLASISLETACLIWFLDAQIAFDQFDNHLFRDIISRFAGNAKVSSSDTILRSVFPAVYKYSIDQQLRFFRSCRSYFTSFDGWSRFNRKFISQSYHMINPVSFEYRIILLDLIPFIGPQFAQTYAAALEHRQDHWTMDMVPEPIRAGGIADSESKPQAAGNLIYGDDMSRCQNHKLKKVYEEAEVNSLTFRRDFDATTKLAVYVCNNATVCNDLLRYQKLNELQELHVFLFNETRWEGRFKVVSRFVELEESLSGVIGGDILEECRAIMDDFLSDSFFRRMRDYSALLEKFNNVSLLYQTQKFPTGCLVPFCIFYLLRITNPRGDDEEGDEFHLTDLKSHFHRAIELHMKKPVLLSCNNFLKSGMLHPGVFKVLLQTKCVPSFVFDECWDSIMSDAESVGLTRAFAELSKNAYCTYVQNMPIWSRKMEWEALFDSGKVCGVSALEFWKSVLDPKSDVKMKELQFLAPVAAMLLAQPAGESVDEFAFSSSGMTLTKERSSLGQAQIEMLTVIRMYIRNFGWSPNAIDEWVRAYTVQAKETAFAAKSGQKNSAN